MITINLEKAKTIAHTIRRNMRAEDFAPLDEQIARQIPGTDVVTLEEQRQSIRDKYALMQNEINLSTNTDEIKQALGI